MAAAGATARTRPSPAHADDFHGWALAQARLLRERRLAEIDLANLAEELETLGAEQEHALESSLRILLLHLLKWQHQPSRRQRSWRVTIVRERLAVPRWLKRNPGLGPKLPALLADAYADARKEAAAETGLPPDRFPPACPYALDAVLDEAFWPGSGPTAA